MDVLNYTHKMLTATNMTFHTETYVTIRRCLHVTLYYIILCYINALQCLKKYIQVDTRDRTSK
jgi:hypothetical protein